jgi:predicted nucleotidyltransferase
MHPAVKLLKLASPSICQQFRLQKLGIFGSYAKNEAQAGSDLDIVYDLEENTRLSFSDLLLLEETIYQKTGVEQIDLVRLRNMNPLVWLTVKNTVIYV